MCAFFILLAGCSGIGAAKSPAAIADAPAAVNSCSPAIPKLTWTSPYSGWSRGVPTDPAFFPLGVWLQIPQHASEFAGIGVNVFVGNNAGTDSIGASDLANLKRLGMYAIIGQDSVGLANISDPTIIAWWMSPDEPDNAQPDGKGGYGPAMANSAIVSEYQTMKAADSTRPIYLGLGQGVANTGYYGRGSNAPPESGYVPGSDIVNFDIYPYNNCGNSDPSVAPTCGQFWLNALGIDNLRQWATRGQATWTWIETTQIDTTGQAPTPTQTASEVWLSIIHGANGIGYFVDTWVPSFREDGVFADPGMVTGLTSLNAKIKSFAPVINSADIPGIVTVSSSATATPVDILVKASGTALYVFAAASRDGTTAATFKIAGLTGTVSVDVQGENRSIAADANGFTDQFAQNAVHIYKIDFATAVCP